MKAGYLMPCFYIVINNSLFYFQDFGSRSTHGAARMIISFLASVALELPSDETSTL